jgi:diguanylate cyclase (GGDEF)-like protein
VSRLARFTGSFTGRMVLAALAMHAVLVPLLALGMHRLVAGDIKDEFINYVRPQSRQLGLVLEGSRSRHEAQAMLQDWLVSGQVVFAELAPEQETPSRGRDAPASGGLTFREDFGFGEHDDDVYFISVPISSVTSELHTILRLGFDEHPVKERISLLYRRGLLLIFAYLTVAIALGWGSGALLSRSIRQLRDAARRVAAGRVDEVLAIPTRITEVASLATDLELMRQELVRRGQVLESLAYYDGLTGLANRMLFNQRLTGALDLARRHSRKLAILYLDLDRFKRVNDTLGHGAGDELLRGVAKRLQDCLRASDLLTFGGAKSSGDLVARLGGDEFTMLLPEISQAEDAGKVAHRLLEALREPLMIGEHRVYATTSVGIALYPFDGDEPETLLKNADTAMYHAKQQGKDRFQYYTASMNTVAAARLELESELHQAIERDQLTLHYQPQIEVRTGRLTGAEALIRWQHPVRGLIPPLDFIPIAEECGLIIPIGEWVIRQACTQLRAWREMGLPALRISVNVSAKQFQQPSFIHTVATILHEFAVQPGTLTVEITETTLMAHEEEAIRQLSDLRLLGVGLSIDDFGTGYSSLAYLNRFSVEALKIDRSFMQDVPENAHNSAIVQAIIALASTLNLQVIAEGVETKHQWQFLADHGCTGMQGYIISKPLPVEAFMEFIQRPRVAPDASHLDSPLLAA